MGYKQLFNSIKLNLTLIVFLSCSIITQAHAKQDNNGLRGIAKSEAHLYEKKGSTWMCLDGSATIPYEAINDDYCDCVDGSDEPGTSACANGKFYCTNAGHIPAYISSKRVNDGVCEPECCDGSDEYDGKVECPNICKEVNVEYRERIKKLTKMRSEGSRIKSEYIQYGITLKQQLESDLERLKIELEAAKVKVTERKATLEKAQKAESKKSKTIDHIRIQKYQEKIRTLREYNERLHDEIDTLIKILRDLKKDHNPNYHDMAVKTAIKGYDEFENKRGVDENMEEDEINEYEIEEIKDDVPQVPEIQMTKPSLSERISDAFLTVYNDFLEMLWLSKYVIHKPEQQFLRTSDGKSKEVIAAHDALDKAEEDRRKVENKIEEINKKFAKDYGFQQEFAKLDGECYDHDVGEYTYTVCMFDKATQKSNKDHGSTHLGYFEKWIGNESKEDPKYYTAQLYDHGTRCWNGPDRSVKLYLECGIENKIISVSEPEKCEYLIKMTTPAICSEKFDEKSIHDEL